MTPVAAPFRFLILVIGGWTFGRAVSLFSATSALLTPSAGVMIAAAGLVTVPIALSSPAPDAQPSRASGITIPIDAPEEAPAGRELVIILGAPPASPEEALQSAMFGDRRAVAPPAAPIPPSQAWLAPPLGPARLSRWSGSAWLFARNDGPGPLATGGQLGGSQAGARLAYRLAELGGGSVALAARLSTPLRDRSGAEAALGVDWHPDRKIPFRLSIERRVAIGRDGRNAWSAHAAGGLYRSLPGELELSAYAQAGVVGARRRDLFADGAVRVARKVALGGEKTLLLGGGVWGAAQPGVTRLDIGPHASFRLPVKGTVVTAAMDWRIRVAGEASPGSGAALTLATDF